MTEALLILRISEYPRQESLVLLLSARKMCKEVYGEFTMLMARIYKNLGVFFKLQSDRSKAYECFRRTWLIRRQILGPHHPATRDCASRLTVDLKDEAEVLNDTVPHDDDDQGP